MKRIAPWLLPTLLGPIIGASAYVLLVSSGSAVPWYLWLVVAGIASALSVFVGALMAITDVVLLKMKMRTPPTGWRAWAMGIAAPVPVLWCWQALLKLAIGALPALPVLWQLVAAFMVPMLGVAVALRVALGTRPAHWKS
jgi:hypothetical protein